jgi:hypothetical protein
MKLALFLKLIKSFLMDGAPARFCHAIMQLCDYREKAECFLLYKYWFRPHNTSVPPRL